MKHQQTKLTPLQMCCNHINPDVETVRSFLDKGAYPNWKDLQDRTALDLVLLLHGSQADSSSAMLQSDVASPSLSFQSPEKRNQSRSSSVSRQSKGDLLSRRDSGVGADGGAGAAGKWRPMEKSHVEVGKFVLSALPVLLELIRKGARFDALEKKITELRPSIKASLLEAKALWEQKKEPANFYEFLAARQLAGEDLMLHKMAWKGSDSSNRCHLCNVINFNYCCQG